ncbi:lipopolysaccharide assembly protein LapB [Pseudomonas cichorii]|uniref:tetratricopeptide repeat protein n=1 Tax=Pseudomonas cichorii TaxID=36746 RepID=UPI001C8AFF45|nr:tetratricopeptide repeat protein [Pseudomonas cichorii]MBX8495392.1 tetratricopeptide repeat protein [Pseudomonas cichorii]MBX8528744.1 tetratricopeptide repeat protein [Pseudomonas cichorii]
MAIDNAPAEHKRLARLLTYLGHDPTNLSLLVDALSLAIDFGDSSYGQQLIDHIKIHAIEAPTVFALAAHLSLQAGQYTAAATFGDKAIEGGVEHLAVIFNTATGHFHSRNYASTHALLSRLSNDPESPATLLMMHARALHQLEETEEAELLVSRAQKQEPSNTEIRGLLALLKYENDNLSPALITAHETLADDPDQLDALIACASVHFEQNNITASRSAWLHTVKTHPECGRAWSGLARLEFNELEFDAAQEHLKTAVQFMPDHIGTWHLLAWIYILRKDSAQARQALNRSYALDRTFGETHGGLAIVDIMDGMKESARKGIRRALKLKPDCLSARYAEALLLQESGQPEKAAQLIDQVLDQTRPDSNDTGRILMEKWLKTHQNKAPDRHPDQH